MSTHRRAWSQRAGVVVALVTGALLTVPATPALAANVNVSPGSVTLNAGGDTTVSVTVAPSLEDKSGQISITGLPSGVSCANGCGSFQFNGPPGTPKTVLLTLKANDNAPDGNGSATVRVVPLPSAGQVLELGLGGFLAMLVGGVGFVVLLVTTILWISRSPHAPPPGAPPGWQPPGGSAGRPPGT